MKKLDDKTWTTPLNLILKYFVKKSELKKDDEFSEWEEDNEIEEDKSNFFD